MSRVATTLVRRGHNTCHAWPQQGPISTTKWPCSHLCPTSPPLPVGTTGSGVTSSLAGGRSLRCCTLCASTSGGCPPYAQPETFDDVLHFFCTTYATNAMVRPAGQCTRASCGALQSCVTVVIEWGMSGAQAAGDGDRRPAHSDMPLQRRNARNRMLLNVGHRLCSLALRPAADVGSTVLQRQPGTETVSVNVRFCWRCEGFFPDPFTATTALQHSTSQYSTAQHSSAQCTTPHLTTIQHTTPQYSTSQHSTRNHSAVQHSTAHHSTVQHSAVQHITAQHSTVQHITAQHSTAQHSTAQHSTAQHSTAQYSTAHHSTVQYSTAQHNTAQYSTGQKGRRLPHTSAQHTTTQAPRLTGRKPLPHRRALGLHRS